MYTQVKICGLTNLDDAIVATQAGADYLGFIFHPKSPRYVTAEAVREIVAAVRNTIGVAEPGAPNSTTVRPRFVGVFVNLPPEQIRDVVTSVGLDFAQLHGDELPEVMAAVTGASYKVLRPKSREEALEAAAGYASLAARTGPQLLVDAYSPDAYGGTGQRTDWAIAAELVAIYPRLMLAGGLNPESVIDAVTSIGPWGVDVSSGVEASPGRKDHDAVRKFIANVRAAS